MNKALTREVSLELIDRTSGSESLEESLQEYRKDIQSEVDRGEYKTSDIDWDYAFQLFEEHDVFVCIRIGCSEQLATVEY